MSGSLVSRGCGCVVAQVGDRQTLVARCASHGARFDELPVGAGLFGSEVIQTLSWEVQLFLSVLMHHEPKIISEIAPQRFTEAFATCQRLAPSFPCMAGDLRTSLMRAGIIVEEPPGHLRLSKRVAYDAERQDFFIESEFVVSGSLGQG